MLCAYDLIEVMSMGKRVAASVTLALSFVAGVCLMYFFQSIVEIMAPIAQIAARVVSLHLW